MLKKWAWMIWAPILFTILLPILLPILLNLHMAARSSADQDPTMQLAVMTLRDGCNINKCGDVYIPYPFGIGPNCYHNHFFDITCNTSSSSPTPFLTRFNLQVVDLTSSFYDHQILVKYVPAKLSKGRKDITSSPLISLSSASNIDGVSNPYSLPAFVNDLVVSGDCDAGATIVDANGSLVRGCTLLCNESKIESSTCRVPVPSLDDLESYHFSHHISKERAASREHNTICVQAGLAINSWNESNPSNPPHAFLQWTGEDLNKSDNVICKTKGKMEYCQCRPNYYGNPYLCNGCQAPQECFGCKTCIAHIYDHSTRIGEAAEVQYRCASKMLVIRPDAPDIGPLAAWIFPAMIGYLAYRSASWLSQNTKKGRNFRRNGGLLLQQHMTTNELGFVDRSVIFTVKALEKATNGFNKKRILGDGGQGTVYKGMLADGRIVAIKKAKVDAIRPQEFINEVIILSNVNHRNVVKLLGCCLETEVPLLVYEYVPNGMLWDHIHNPQEDYHVTWQMRLQIAIEVAGGLAYLHSSSSTPVFHRDIKSKNILLDEKYKAKIADFGISRSVSIDQTHLTTRVCGTFGYLDPEYFHSQQLTDKSDVYSFGIVLLELLTRKQPILDTQSGEKEGLSEAFLHLMESSELDDILDPCIVEGNKEELLAVAELAAQCLKKIGSDRPTMTEVVTTLQAIRSQPQGSLGEMHQEIEGDASEPSETGSYGYLTSSSCSTSSFVTALT